MRYISAWNSSPEPQPSPDGSLVARIVDACEFQMSGPVVGRLLVSNGIVEENCGVSIVWSADSRYLAAPRLFSTTPVHFRIRLIDTATGRKRFAPGRYGPVALAEYTGASIVLIFDGAAGQERLELDLSRIRWASPWTSTRPGDGRLDLIDDGFGIQEAVVRKVTYGAACSLDGFIAREDGDVDWLRWSSDVERISAAFWSSIDTVLMGRKTYEVAVAMGTRSYPGVHNVVFSRSLEPSDFPEVEIVAIDATEHVRRLKQAAGRGIGVMGGGILASALLNDGLVDEVGVNIHPVLLGSGIPFLTGLKGDIQLALKHHEGLSHGCVYLSYAVARMAGDTTESSGHKRSGATVR